MFDKVIHAVVLLQMLAHSICGCCWHHVHSIEIGSCQQVSHSAPPVSHCCCHSVCESATEENAYHSDEACSDHQSEAPQHHPQIPCGQDRCQYVSSLTSHDVQAVYRHVLGTSDVVHFTSMSSPLSYVATGWNEVDYVLSLTSARRCALNQVWRI